MPEQAASLGRVHTARRPRVFYSTVGVFAAGVVFVGFARTYYLKEFFGTPTLPLLVHIHGLLMTCWMVLLIVQSVLVASRRTYVHRRLGWAGSVLALGIIFVGSIVAIRAVRLGHAPTGISPFSFLVIPLGDIVMFTALVGAALYYRQRTELHKRLMLVATIAILPAGIARWPWPLVAHQPIQFFAVADLILLGCIAYDYLKTHRINPAYCWGGLLLILSHPLRLMLAHTVAWTTFAHWITGA